MSRGLWLILIEVTLITLGITADIHFGFIALQTIWAIGFSMLLLGLIIWLPFNIILLLGLVIVLGHNSLDFVEARQMGGFPWYWGFHHPVFIPFGDGKILAVFYPFLPWTGLMMLGYCCGKIFTSIEPPKRNKLLLAMGIGSLVFFALLRFSNLYGDPGHWTTQKDGVFTFLSFMNVQKYPPSLLYMCATIGVALIVLGLVNKTSSALSRIIIVYGRVPFFYYILHFYLLDIIKISLYLSRGHSFAEGVKGVPGLPFKFAMPGEGYSLAITYLIWISVVIALYPLCKWYDRYKTSHPEKKWLSYI